MGARRVTRELRGIVKRGRGDAGRAGFPTANIRAPDELRPGAYVAEWFNPAPPGQAWYGCVVAVVGGWAEVHVIGWRSGELYGRELHLLHLRRVPDELMANMLAVTLAAAL